MNIPFHELNFEYTRSRGPGGQNVNRTNSACVLRFCLSDSSAFTEMQKHRLLDKLASKMNEAGEILIRSDEFRDQDQNRKACIEKLHQLLKAALFVPKTRIATKPKKSAVKKRLNEKRHRSDIKKGRGSSWD